MTRPDQIDALFTEWDRESTPGCALAIVRDGAIVDARGYGRASLEHHAPISPATIFHVASISKQFTAFAVALLAHEGALALDDDIRRTLPELPDFGAPITLRHLIHHTSGLRDQWELLQLAGWRWDDLMTTADILDLVSRQRALNFAPGAEFAYCNTGYTLMAEIVAKVSGMPFRAFCAGRIFEPLGMRATHFHDDHTEVVPGRAHSYYPGDGGVWHHAVLNYATVGATSLFTTVEDLARWDRNFETGEVGGPAVLAQMLEPGRLNDGTVLPYAFGLVARTHNGRRVVEHSGGDAGFRAHVARFPDQRLSVIVLGNTSTLNPMERAHQVADITLGSPGLSAPAAADERVIPDEAALAGFAGLYHSAATSETRAIALRDGRLMLGRGQGAALRAVAADTFQIEGNREIQLRFVRPAGGGPPELHVASGVLPPVVYLAVPQASPTAEDLAAYAGRYRSDELDVVYTVATEEGKLVVRRRKHAPTTLEPAHLDAFNGDADVQFTRDVAGQVDGFLLTTGRVRNLRFARAEPS